MSAPPSPAERSAAALLDTLTGQPRTITADAAARAVSFARSQAQALDRGPRQTSGALGLSPAQWTDAQRDPDTLTLRHRVTLADAIERDAERVAAEVARRPFSAGWRMALERCGPERVADTVARLRAEAEAGAAARGVPASPALLRSYLSLAVFGHLAPDAAEHVRAAFDATLASRHRAAKRRGRKAGQAPPRAAAPTSAGIAKRLGLPLAVFLDRLAGVEPPGTTRRGRPRAGARRRRAA